MYTLRSATHTHTQKQAFSPSLVQSPALSFVLPFTCTSVSLAPFFSLSNKSLGFCAQYQSVGELSGTPGWPSPLPLNLDGVVLLRTVNRTFILQMCKKMLRLSCLPQGNQSTYISKVCSPFPSLCLQSTGSRVNHTIKGLWCCYQAGSLVL